MGSQIHQINFEEEEKILDYEKGPIDDSLIVVNSNSEIAVIKLKVNNSGSDFEVEYILKPTKLPKLFDKVISFFKIFRKLYNSFKAI